MFGQVFLLKRTISVCLSFLAIYVLPKAVREIVFVDPLMKDKGTRVCVSAAAVKAMKKAIAVLARKTDNLVLTLKSCREHYYKEPARAFRGKAV